MPISPRMYLKPSLSTKCKTFMTKIGTGTTFHVTDNPSNLHTCTPHIGSDKLMVGHGEYLDITHVGSLDLPGGQHHIPLNNVFVVPKIKKNLTSISQLNSSIPYVVEFSSTSFAIKDQQTKQVVAVGSREDDLYALKPSSNKVFFSTRFRMAPFEVWHGCLGRPHRRILEFMAINKLIFISN